MKNVFRILAVILLGLSVASCELFSKSYWDGVNESRREEGRRCYKRADGVFYCKDKYGNRVY